MSELYKNLKERPYIDAFHYIEWLGEKIEDRKLITINRFLQEDRKMKDKEIERLNKERENDIKYNKYLQKELAKSNNIIKEVREYITKHNETIRNRKELGVYGEFMIIPNELLEILEGGKE